MATTKIISVKQDQTILDIAVQEYGSIEGAYDIVELNGMSSVQDNLECGDQLMVGEVKNKAIKTYLEDFEIVSGGDDARAEGIGFWRVDLDLIIS